MGTQDFVRRVNLGVAPMDNYWERYDWCLLLNYLACNPSPIKIELIMKSADHQSASG